MAWYRPLPVLAFAAVLGAAAPSCLLDTSPYSTAPGSGAAGPGSGAAGPGGGAAGPGGSPDGGGGSGAAGGASTGGAGGGGDGGASTGGTAGSGGASTGGGTGGEGGTGGGGGGPVGTDACPGPEITLGVYSSVTLVGSTVAASNDAGSSCGGGMGPDVVYQVVPEESGTLVATLSPADPFKGFVHVRSDCQDPLAELECGTADVRAPVTKGVPVFVIVDGQMPDPSGQFSLELTLDGCGNGIIEKPQEECDDGNTLFLDGCSSACQVECDCPAVATDCNPFEDTSTHHCYAMVKTPDATWDEANFICQSWGGILAVLATTTEIDVVKSKVSDDPWIGANDLVMDGKFAWINGEPFTYTNGEAPWETYVFQADEPNGGTNENCAEIYDNGRLNDDVCSVAHNYLCERAPAGTLPVDVP